MGDYILQFYWKIVLKLNFFTLERFILFLGLHGLSYYLIAALSCNWINNFSRGNADSLSCTIHGMAAVPDVNSTIADPCRAPSCLQDRPETEWIVFVLLDLHRVWILY